MFVGRHEYRVDEKGRIPIPPSFRREFNEGGFFTEGAGNCIAVYTPARFYEISASLKTTGLPGADIRSLSRNLFASADVLKLDAQGRATLPPALREYAGIKDAAIVVGVNDYAEIWSPDRWNALQQAEHERAWQVIETLEQKSQPT